MCCDFSRRWLRLMEVLRSIIYRPDVTGQLPDPAGKTSCRSCAFRIRRKARAKLRQEIEAAKTEIDLKPCQNVTNYSLPLMAP